MSRTIAIRKVLPVLLPAITAIAVAIVYIRLSCIDGAVACGNVSQMINETAVHQSAFQEIIELFGL